MPRLRGAVIRGEAAVVVGDLNVVKVAVFNYEAEHGSWPGEAGPGETPSGLEEYLPAGFSLHKPKYDLDYDNRVGSGVFDVGISLVTQAEELGQAVFHLLGGGTYSVGDRHTWIIVR
jgi:hypothetical protein